MLWLSRACSRNVPSSFIVLASPKVSSLEEAWAYLYLPFFPISFLSVPSVSSFISLDCSRKFRPSSWALHDEVSDVLDFFFLFFFCARPAFRTLAVIKPHCLVFRGPSAAARLPSDAPCTSVASCLLHNPGHAPPLPFFFFNIFEAIEVWVWILLLLFQSGSYGCQPWVIFVSTKKQKLTIKKIWFDSK